MILMLIVAQIVWYCCGYTPPKGRMSTASKLQEVQCEWLHNVLDEVEVVLLVKIASNDSICL